MTFEPITPYKLPKFFTINPLLMASLIVKRIFTTNKIGTIISQLHFHRKDHNSNNICHDALIKDQKKKYLLILN